MSTTKFGRSGGFITRCSISKNKMLALQLNLMIVLLLILISLVNTHPFFRPASHFWQARRKGA